MRDRDRRTIWGDEGTIIGATSSEDFYASIEPLPEPPEGDLADALGLILDIVFLNGKRTSIETSEQLRLKLDSAFRKFVSLTLLVRPQAISPRGIPARRIAESLGCTGAAISKQMVELGDLFAMKSPSMRSRAARTAYSAAGGAGAGSRIKKRSPSHIGDETYQDRGMAERDAVTIRSSLIDFIDGLNIQRLKKDVLKFRGIMDSEGGFTDSGADQLAVIKQELIIESLDLVKQGRIQELPRTRRQLLAREGIIDADGFIVTEALSPCPSH